MKTKICKYCREEISASASRCPKCGGKFGTSAGVKAVIIVVVIIFCVVGCVSSCSNSVNEAIKDTKNAYKDINGKTTFKVSETFQNKYEKITMLETNTNFTEYSKYFGPADGNKVVMVKFEVENINEDNDELYVSSLGFNGYADNVAAKTFVWSDNKYNDLSATVGKGKKTIGYVFYEVPKNTQKITVEYNADFWLDGTTIEFIVQ